MRASGGAGPASARRGVVLAPNEMLPASNWRVGGKSWWVAGSYLKEIRRRKGRDRRRRRRRVPGEGQNDDSPPERDVAHTTRHARHVTQDTPRTAAATLNS